MTAEQAAHQMELVTEFFRDDRETSITRKGVLHDDHEQEEQTEPAVGHDGGYYARPDGTCRYCEGRHPLEGAA